MIRAAVPEDILHICKIYEDIFDEDLAGRTSVGWVRGVYPKEQTATDALKRGELFVAEVDGTVAGSAIINKDQVDCYKDAAWHFYCEDSDVMVMHTLAISPAFFRRGIGRVFVAFYERYARENNCFELRLDTQTKNVAARKLYVSCGFEEVGVVDCIFNGIPDIHLLLLEKHL